MNLIIRRAGVNPKFAALRDAGGIVALRIDAPAVAVLILAGPGNDKIAGGIRRDGPCVKVIRRATVETRRPAVPDDPMSWC